ncbi:hypothetical protein [Arthrobacter sp. ZGTC412]|uniref:hypothetical protein n=1 Tax=Arthrobacter sp. ZGTC412 TaxID=2058900 RepID=UPI0011B0BB19|nr:hypothetical protein [Arthrobacter sp. ZGTC412]
MDSEIRGLLAAVSACVPAVRTDGARRETNKELDAVHGSDGLAVVEASRTRHSLVAGLAFALARTSAAPRSATSPAGLSSSSRPSPDWSSGR